MSLARTALRIAVIEALASHPVIAARCPGRVFDSLIGDFDSREKVPTIVVLTEELSGEPANVQNGGAPWLDACDLVLEVAMSQRVEQDGEDFIFRPVTDREMEAALDLIEECADWMITLGRPTPRSRPTAAGQILTNAVTRRVSKRTSSRFSDDETGQKLAIHQMTFRVELKGEEIDFRALPTGPFAILPDPLRTVARSLPEGSSGLITCQMIANELDATAASIPTLRQATITTPADPAAQVPGTLPVNLTVDFPQEP